MKRAMLLVSAAALSTGAVAAEPVGYFPVGHNVVLESGDGWIDAAKHYRLYGVQACLRGTFYTDKGGQRRDCGEASLAVLSAYILDTHPLCATVAQARGTIYVACYALIGQDRVDLANLMITSGFAFAALGRDGLPVYPPYAVAEQGARGGRAGLWQFSDVEHPAVLLGQAVRQTGPAQ